MAMKYCGGTDEAGVRKNWVGESGVHIHVRLGGFD